MLKIKLFQKGKKHQRTYRIVVAEARSKRDGKFTDDLGSWNPKENQFKVDEEKFKLWQKNGARLTEGVKKIIKQIA